MGALADYDPFRQKKAPGRGPPKPRINLTSVDLIRLLSGETVVTCGVVVVPPGYSPIAPTADPVKVAVQIERIAAVLKGEKPDG